MRDGQIVLRLADQREIVDEVVESMRDGTSKDLSFVEEARYRGGRSISNLLHRPGSDVRSSWPLNHREMH